MQTPRFFYFDLGNVLLAFDHRRACANIAELSGAAVDDVWKFIFEGTLQYDYESGRVTCEEFHQAFCEATSTQTELAAMKRAASDMFEPIEATVSIARQLREQTDQVGILSNTCRAHWEFVGETFPHIGAIFPRAALSFELMSMKPEPEIYARAAELAERKPAEIFFVDDRPENVEGAKTAGFDAVLFTSPGNLLRDLQSRGMLLEAADESA